MHRGFKDGARLHLGNFGMDDAQPAAAEAEHGIELVQILHALEQRGQLLLQLAHRDAVAFRHLLFLFAAGVRKQCQIHHQVLALRQELVQRRIERANDHRIAVHRFKQSGEILALHGQQLLERLIARLFVLGQNHGLHERNAIGREEHVLGTAQSDAFGAELARGYGIARNIGIGPHAEITAKLIGPFHELDEQGRLRIGLFRLGLAEINVGRGSVERNPVALFDDDVFGPNLHRELLLVLFDVQRARADHARQTHAARNHRRVARLAAHRGQHARRYFHAVNIVRRGFLADQDHRALLDAFHRLIGVKHSAADGGSRRSVDTVRDLGQRLERRLIEQRMQQLIQLRRGHAQHRFLLVDQTFLHHFHRHAQRRRAGAFAIARLQHEQLAVFDGELEILHVAIMLFEAGGNISRSWR